jgi:hypothetical protein
MGLFQGNNIRAGSGVFSEPGTEARSGRSYPAKDPTLHDHRGRSSLFRHTRLHLAPSVHLDDMKLSWFHSFLRIIPLTDLETDYTVVTVETQEEVAAWRKQRSAKS